MNSSPLAPIRVGLIGVSGYGRVYLRVARQFQQEGRLRLVAATVINADEEAATVAELKRDGTRIYDAYEEMIAHEAEHLDACLVPTGIPWHARMTIAALRAGLDVLVEKPLAGCMADVEAIRATERLTGRFVAVGFQDIYGDLTMVLKEQLCSGAIGEVKSIRMIGIWPRTGTYFQRNGWSGRLRASGAIINDSPFQNGLAHFVNLAFFLAGSTPSESADVTLIDGELFRTHAIESFDTAVTRARTSAGLRFWFGGSHASSQQRDVVLQIEGTCGTVEWHHEARQLIVHRDGEPPDVRRLPALLETRVIMFNKFLRRCQSRAGFIADSAMALKHVQFTEAVHRTLPIRDVEPSVIKHIEIDAKTYITIPAINDVLECAFERETLLSTAGFSHKRPCRAAL